MRPDIVWESPGIPLRVGTQAYTQPVSGSCWLGKLKDFFFCQIKKAPSTGERTVSAFDTGTKRRAAPLGAATFA